MFESLSAADARQDKKNSETIGEEFIRIDKFLTVDLPISSLLLDDSPRQAGESDEHVRALAESEEVLPPIIVHDQSMRVIDGIHRTRAAVMCGEKCIKAKLYQGTNADAFVLAVRMNRAHGLPLTHADRTAAAIRIIGSHPHWSDRMIATAVGLAGGTVGRLRRRSTAQVAQSATRVGKDGRARPIDKKAGRLKVNELLAEKPTASIRTIAKEAGVSPSTVYNARQILRAGDNPALAPQSVQKSSMAPLPPKAPLPPRMSSNLRSAESVDAASILDSLTRDPSLRFSEGGRSVLRWLHMYRIGVMESNKIADTVPDHCAGSVARLARTFAQVWIEVAAQLEQRSP